MAKEKFIVILIPESKYATATQIPFWEFSSVKDQKAGKVLASRLLEIYDSIDEFLSLNRRTLLKMKGLHGSVTKEENHVIYNSSSVTKEQKELIYEYNLKNNLKFNIQNFFFKGENRFTPWELNFINTFKEEGSIDLSKTGKLKYITLDVPLEHTGIPSDAYKDVLKTLIICHPSSIHELYSWNVL